MSTNRGRGRPSIAIYAYGISSCSICVPKDLTREEIEAEMNAIHPSGIASPWVISGNSHFARPENHTNPCVCDRDPERLHYLMEC